jgi:hypothetical protein
MARAWNRVQGAKQQIEGTGSWRDPAGAADLTGHTVIRPWRRQRGGTWLFTLFALLWNGFLVASVSATLHGPLTMNGRHYDSLGEALRGDRTAPLFVVAFPLAGLFFAYLALAMWLNRTTVTIRDGNVELTRARCPSDAGACGSWLPPSGRSTSRPTCSTTTTTREPSAFA